MQKKYVIGIGLVALVGLAVSLGDRTATDANDQPIVEETMTETVTDMNDSDMDETTVSEGVYVVLAEESMLRWAGKKPLIQGYINNGTLGINQGTITVTPEGIVGGFEIDMNTLSVSETQAKPGRESMLQGHLKGENWFDVATYPTASFVISEVTPLVENGEEHQYSVRGDLTMKGVTHELTFPATMYLDADGTAHADASLEFDRTLWGITAGSGSFFDNLADNVIDDMVELSFSLVAAKQ